MTMQTRNLFERVDKSVRLAGLGAAGVAAISAGAIGASDALTSSERSERLEIALLRGARIVGDTLYDAFTSKDVGRIESFVASFGTESSLDGVVVLDNQLTPVAETGVGARMVKEASIAELLNIGYGSTTVGNFSYAVHTVTDDGAPVGTLVVRARHDMHPLYQSPSAWRTLLLSLGLGALSAPAFLLGYRRFATPKDEIAGLISMMGPGECGPAVDKINLLDKSFGGAVTMMARRYEEAFLDSRLQSATDPITGLTNRAHFMKLMESRIRSCGEKSATLALIDVVRFSRVNDLVGPQKADLVLQEVGNRLKTFAAKADATLRPDLCEEWPIHVGRLGADLFAVLIPFSDNALARQAMDIVSTAFDKPFSASGESHKLSILMAAAESPADAKSGSDLLKQAEMAMAKAKTDRTPGLFFYNRAMAEDARDRMKLEAEVRRGVENGEFVAVYQPKIAFGSSNIVGAEALARWRRPDGSAVSPGRFIPIAEELGLISKLGVSVLRDACMAAAKWDNAGMPVRVAVNVSPHQFEDPEFIPSIYEAMEESKLPPELLELEITESVAVEDPDKVARIMRPLRAKGVRLAIDDFGTGHSNFTTVTRLPFDVFKIDQQFVRALDSDAHAPAIIEMILAMAEALGQESVAEGVETFEQFDFLRRRACTVGQGYYFSPPLPGHEFQSFLNHWRTSTPLQRIA